MHSVLIGNADKTDCYLDMLRDLAVDACVAKASTNDDHELHGWKLFGDIAGDCEGIHTLSSVILHTS